jgi:hypothetical protein
MTLPPGKSFANHSKKDLRTTGVNPLRSIGPQKGMRDMNRPQQTLLVSLALLWQVGACTSACALSGPPAPVFAADLAASIAQQSREVALLQVLARYVIREGLSRPPRLDCSQCQFVEATVPTIFKTVTLAGAALGLASCAMIRNSENNNENYEPRIEPKEFRARVDNPWFPLVPGTVFRYRERKGAEITDDVMTVMAQTKVVMGVPCTVVHDVVSEHGVVKEDTYDWFSQDDEGNVWYLGEDSSAYDDRGGVSKEGSWEAGIDGAQPGIMMYAKPVPGPGYWQEHATDAQDKAQVMALREAVQVPFGSYPDSVRTKEWSELEAGSSMKWYVRGVGFVRSEAEDGEISELISMGKAP